MTEMELVEQGYRKYQGEEVDVFFKTSICIHAGNCVRGNSAIFDLERRPWVLPDNAEKQEVVRVVETCPSGALKYIQHSRK